MTGKSAKARMALRALLSIAALAVGAASTESPAQAFPQKSVKLVVGFAAGGITDTLARIVGEAMTADLGQPVVVENRAGAGGTLAAAVVAAAAPDGYTLLINATSDVINPIINRNVRYDIEASFSPIGLIASVPNVLVVHPSLPVASARELAEYAKARPDALNYGSAGVGTISHLSGAQFAAMAHARCVHIPYKGNAAAQADLLGGRLQFMFDSMGNALANAKAGKVRALAVTSLSRWPGAPGLPSMAESGFPGFDMVVWFGLLAPADTPPPVIARLSAALTGSLRDAEVRKRIALLNAEPGRTTPAGFGRHIHAENLRWKKLFADGVVSADE
jgi:tripartite-type tricarboxylate transporter receptor subunit TctC